MSRSATRISFFAAILAGSSPPIAPIISANPTPIAIASGPTRKLNAISLNDAKLIIAVRREDDSFHWHAWVTRDGQPVHERAESLRAYIPVVVFDGQGSVEWSDPTATSPLGISI